MAGDRDVPPSKQCTMSSCAKPATDPAQPSSLCEEHRDGLDADDADDTGEEWIDDPEFDGSAEAVRDHHKRVRLVYETLAALGDSPTAGFSGNSGWYQYRYERDLELWELEAGHRIHRRVYTIERDYDELLRGFEADPEDSSWRSFYNIVSWKDRSAVYEGMYAAEYDEYGSGDGAAGYSDMRGFALWVDFDLTDNDDGVDGPNYKKRRGQLTDDERETVERALAATVKEFAALAGCEPADIAVFDSGGGAYLYVPAAVTLPIADRYEDDNGPYGDARELIFRELRQRMFAYATGTPVNANASDYDFKGIETRVFEQVPGATELLDPDWMQNRNRQSKAPGTIHGDHDVAVTPARDPNGGFDYAPTRVSELAKDNALIEWTAAEAAKIVAVPDDESLGAMTEAFVSTLFGDLYAGEGAESWTDALDTWLADRRERERADAHQRALDEQRQRKRLDDRREEITATTEKPATDLTTDDLLTGLSVTPIRKDVFDALENPRIVDVRDVIRDHCADSWDTSNRKHETTFDPSWRGSSSGMSCAVPSGENQFVDNGCDGGGSPAKAYALGNGILPAGPNGAARSFSGRRWGRAIDGLRSEYPDIPLFVPEAGSENSDGEEYERTPLWALRNAAVALDVCALDEFKEQETDDGETYLGFDRETYNATLDELDEAGIDHGRERIESGGSGAVEPIPSIPFTMLSRPRDELVRYARKRGMEWPSTEEARERLETTITDLLSEEDSAVVDGPTGLGKSHLIAMTRWRELDDEITGGQPVVLFAGTHDARDEVVAMADEADADLDVKVLYGYSEACPVAGGHHDPENCAEEIIGEVIAIDESTEGEEFIVRDTDAMDHKDRTAAFRARQEHDDIERDHDTPNCIRDVRREHADELGISTKTIPQDAGLVRATVEYQVETENEYGKTRTRTQTRTLAINDTVAVGEDFVIQEEQEPLFIDGTVAGQWFEHHIERKRIAASSVHSKAERLASQGYVGHDPETSANGHGDVGELPCCPAETRCNIETQWPEDGFTDDDGVPLYDLVVATDLFAHVPSLRTHTNIIHDEQPDYATTLGETNETNQQRIRKAVTAYLRAVDAPREANTFEDLVHTAEHGFGNPHGKPAGQVDDELQDALDTELGQDWYFEEPDAHTLAPGLTKAIYYAARTDADANGRRTATVPHEPPRLDANASDDEGWNRSWLTVVLNDENDIETIREAPDFSTARSVVGLDAWPNPYLWQRNVHPAMTIERVLDTEERSLWRRLEQGKIIIGLGDATRPAGSDGKYFSKNHADAVIEQLRDEFGEEFKTAGCAKAVEDRMRELLGKHGVRFGDDDEHGGTMHYGGEESRNDFADEAVGLVYGCIDPGDDYILNLAAECELDVQPQLHECPTCEGEGCGPEEPDCRDGERRSHGREFVGDDSEAGAALLSSVRESHVAQMAGRFGRTLDDDHQSLVFVATDATPPGLVDVRVPGVTWLARPSQKQRALIDYLRQVDHRPTAREASEAVGCSKEHARQVFRALVDQNKATAHETAGEHGADIFDWCDGGSAAGPTYSTVDLCPNDIANSDVWNTITWKLAISSEGSDDDPGETPETPKTPSDPDGQTSIGAFAGGDPPPDEAS